MSLLRRPFLNIIELKKTYDSEHLIFRLIYNNVIFRVKFGHGNSVPSQFLTI